MTTWLARNRVVEPKRRVASPFVVYDRFEVVAAAAVEREP
jgi:hypothetical protein